MESWWILVQRGEQADVRPYLRRCLSEAFWLRRRPEEWRRWVLSPGFPFVAAGVPLALAAAITRGFGQTRALLSAPGEALGVVSFATGFAIMAGMAFVFATRPRLPWHGWRYCTFLAVKVVMVICAAPALWAEFCHAIGPYLPRPGPAMPLCVLALGAALIFGVAYGLGWAFADQRRRCPVCLSLLDMPGTMGSWASVFELVSTEMMCAKGHGFAMDAGERRTQPLDGARRFVERSVWRADYGLTE